MKVVQWGMAKHIVYVNGEPACPRCGSTSFRNKSALEWGRSTIQCVGCGTGLLPATGRDVRAARREAFAPAPPAEHHHDWRDRTPPDERHTSRLRVDECAACGERRVLHV